ncbi:MAG TPA: hypothetical protein VKI00_17685 [Mycobacterium sp.]|uniref:hypothetical protein n=1 Tax=Mycobacterium sp. TaxID=1785 RepID=UPI002BB96D68|nr:hypothetical protein [Mycobacterium sp.]HME77405.1 hypothetical protein [Mycobacterium sp.]
MPRRKQVYKITYPNGKIYVGMDLTGSALYMGSPSAYAQIVADLELEPGCFELTLRKEILWECETATDDEVRKIEKENNPRDQGERSRDWSCAATPLVSPAECRRPQAKPALIGGAGRKNVEYRSHASTLIQRQAFPEDANSVNRWLRGGGRTRFVWWNRNERSGIQLVNYRLHPHAGLECKHKERR